MGHRAQVGARAVALVAILGLVACPSKPHKATGVGVPLKFARGGVVRAGMLTDDLGQSGPGQPVLDPSREYSYEGFEILRCCLTRTLYSYNGHPTSEGGAELRPDLATALPDVSSDGLTWTIHMRKGVHYAPPLAQQEVVSQDIVTALKRVAKVTKQDEGDYQVYYSVIRGFDQYAKGQADSISGIATPDPYTIIFTLTTRTGDFADRFTMPGTAPIPTLASAPGEFGVATGHDGGYAQFLIGTGPYMFQGTEALTPAAPAKEQKPVAGLPSGGKVIELVRNPSWDPAEDPLRPAYPDRVEIHFAATPKELTDAMDKDSVDVVLYGGPPADYPLDQLRRYQADPALGRTLVVPRDSVRYMTMNIAVPPFDDIHVRKAANFIVNKKAYINAIGGPLEGAAPTHIVLDSLEDGRLVNYDPYRTSSLSDALEKAKAEMRLSKYDHNHDGLCDAAVCDHILTLAFPRNNSTVIRAARSVATDLARIGVNLRIEPVGGSTFFQTIVDPTKRIPVGIAPGWSHDFLNASNFITPLFAGSRVSTAFIVPGAPLGSCCNYSNVGATAAQLHGWGYAVTKVPGADDRINDCLQLVGNPQVECWTALDQYLTETVVPWVPLLLENSINVIPKRVVNFSLDQFTTLPSLDQIVVQGGPTPSPS